MSRGLHPRQSRRIPRLVPMYSDSRLCLKVKYARTSASPFG